MVDLSWGGFKLYASSLCRKFPNLLGVAPEVATEKMAAIAKHGDNSTIGAATGGNRSKQSLRSILAPK